LQQRPPVLLIFFSKNCVSQSTSASVNEAALTEERTIGINDQLGEHRAPLMLPSHGLQQGQHFNYVMNVYIHMYKRKAVKAWLPLNPRV